MDDSEHFFKKTRDAESKFLWGGKEVSPSGGNRVEINGEEYILSPEMQRAFTDTRYKSNNIDMGDESVLKS